MRNILISLAFVLVVSVIYGADKSTLTLADIEQLARDGKKVEAIRGYRELIAADPANIDLHRGYQNMMREVGDMETASKEYKVYLDANPDSALYNYLYGRLMSGTDTEAYFQKAIKLDKNFVWAYYGLGQFYLDSKQYADSAKYFEATLRLKPDFIEANHYLAMVAYETNDIERAIKEWTAVLSAKPNYPDARLGLGLAYKAKGEYANALDILEPLIEKRYWKAFEPAIQCYHARTNYKMAALVRKQLRDMSVNITAIPEQITIGVLRTDKYLLICREFIRSEQNRIEFDIYTFQNEKEKSVDISGRKPDKSIYAARVKETTRVILRKEGKSDDGKPLGEELASYYKMIPSYQRLLADVQEYLKQ
ncbi:MAG: tetratricopeptide repeat protein [Planctomycetota bacterium]